MSPDLNNRLTLNEYLYALGNPLRWVDPDGRRVTIWTQAVVHGIYHASVHIVPENQDLYKNDSNFIPGPDGKIFATLGAGPSFLFTGSLVSKPDRQRDIDISIKNLETLPLNIPFGTEDLIISKLFRLDKNYNDDLPYQAFPTPLNNGYNSNSYVSGLLNTAGIDIPLLNLQINLPGFDKPVPASNFGEGK